MNIEDLKEHLDKRLDAMDKKHSEIEARLVQLEIEAGKGFVRLEEKMLSNEERHEELAATCEARHKSTESRVAVIRSILLWCGMGIVATAVVTVWNRVMLSER